MSTCINRRVGCIIVDADDNILSTGFNGAPAGHDHCTDTLLCRRTLPGKRDDNCVAVHAEANAVLRAEQRGVSLRGSRAYITMSPCKDCLELLIDAGVEHVYFELLHHEDKPDIAVQIHAAANFKTYECLVIQMNSGMEMKRCVTYPTSRKRNGTTS